MIVHKASFPHPVLAPFRDDVSPNDFEFSLKISWDADNWYLDVGFEYSNPTLSQLVQSYKAMHSVHLECRRNFYRELFSFQERSNRLTIKADELVGRVEVSAFVCAKEPVERYRIAGAHEDYGNSTFQIRVGDVLAVYSTQCFDAYIDYDPLKSISSILNIRRDQHRDDGPMRVETDDDIIVVTLSQNDYDKYTDLKADPAFGPLLANQVVVPSLLQCIYEIRDVSELEFEEGMASHRWYRSVYKKLLDSGIDLRKPDRSALEALQSLLQLPLRRSLHTLMQIDSSENSA
jgi:hypothetical protein